MVTARPDTVYFDFNQDVAAQLIPFEQLVKLAVSFSPLVRYEAKVSESQQAIYRLSKYQILQSLSGFALYSTGDQAIVSTNNTGTEALGQIANGYRVGVNLQVNLYDVFGRPHYMRQYKANQEAAVIRREGIELQVKRELIDVYQNLLTAQRILKVRLQDERNSLAALQIAEVEFQQRRIDPNVLANVSNRYSIAKSSSEEAKGELLKNFFNLEALVGVPLTELRRK
ncbi:hypothetical protein GCM10023187_33360 [Nibrella viscosa]|uniref:Outer membrane efflux protein n=1 Tax=Nibrella viscosa TaxID=1084524 RepID=A0ABP8KMH1_9BACT